MTFGFIVPCFINSENALVSLKKCLNSIRKYHQELIVLVNNHSPIDISNVIEDISDVKIVLSPVPSCGEFNAYLIFHEFKYFDKAIVIHDTMYLKKRMTRIDEIERVKLIKYFTDHIKDWSNIKEPHTEYNRTNNIKTHDDLIIHLLKSVIVKNKEFYEYASQLYFEKREWVA